MKTFNCKNLEYLNTKNFVFYIEDWKVKIHKKISTSFNSQLPAAKTNDH